MNKRTPLYDRHVAHQARMVPFAGLEYAGAIRKRRAGRT